MKTIIIENYYTGEIIKKVKYPEGHSVSYGVEGNYFVIRDYYTNAIIKRVKKPNCSIKFYVESKGDSWYE